MYQAINRERSSCPFANCPQAWGMGLTSTLTFLSRPSPKPEVQLTFQHPLFLYGSTVVCPLLFTGCSMRSGRERACPWGRLLRCSSPNICVPLNSYVEISTIRVQESPCRRLDCEGKIIMNGINVLKDSRETFTPSTMWNRNTERRQCL